MPRYKVINKVLQQYHHQMLLSLIQKCRYENNVDRQINLLRQINSELSESIRIRLPSLITDDYVGRALDIIEERILNLDIDA